MPVIACNLTRVGWLSWRFDRGFQSPGTRWSVGSRSRLVNIRRGPEDEAVVVRFTSVFFSDIISSQQQNTDVYKRYEKQQTDQNVGYDPCCYRHTGRMSLLFISGEKWISVSISQPIA